MCERNDKMIFSGDNVRLNNIFTVCDAIAMAKARTRKDILAYSHLSRPTVIKATEALLDTGLINERLAGDHYRYRMNPVCIYAIADLRYGFFMTFTDGTGRVLRKIEFHELSVFYYDERLSLFFRNISQSFKKLFPKGRIVGIAVILPSGDDEYRNTRSILGSQERLLKLVSSYFSVKNIAVLKAVDAAAEMIKNERALLIIKEETRVFARAVGYADENVAVLKTVGRTEIGSCCTGASLAAELAYAVGNLCTVLAPEEIYLDGDGLFAFSAFPRRFREALSGYLGIESAALPNAHHSDGSLVLCGAVRYLRCKYIESQYNFEEVKK